MQMATAQKVTAGRKRPITKRRRLRRVLLALALAALAALAWLWQPLQARAVTGASYAARIACPCRFIAGRALPACRSDFEPGMGWVILREDAEAKSVTAWVPLLSSQTATFREGEGCQLEGWKD
jgi:hypothetical protein